VNTLIGNAVEGIVMTVETDLLRIDDQLGAEERLIRDTVRSYVNDHVLPDIGDWFEAGTLPKSVLSDLGKLGLYGMHLTGYGCAGTSATAYGVACRELEAGDSGIRSVTSVQGSLAMFPIWKYGSDEQKDEWLPRMADGAAIGCFGLTEPDQGSDPGSMRTRAVRDGSDWVLNGTKMWITNGSVADIAVVWASTDSGIRGFLVPRGTPGFSATDIHKKMALRASVTSELVLDSVRLPSSAVLPGVTGLRGPLSCLTEALGGHRRGACLPGVRGVLLHDADPVRQGDRGIPAHPVEARLDGGLDVPGAVARAAPRAAQGGGHSHAHSGQRGQAG
jgi:glutaryl-CoA dehydrogenase